MPRASSPRRATLRLLGESGAACHLVLDQPHFQIGRAAESCALVLDDPEIAPQHCCLRRQGHRWWLLDRGSRTGTYVNNHLCREPTELHDRDRISVGLHRLEFRTAPAHSLQDTLARLGNTRVELDLEPAPIHPPARPRGLLRAVCLAITLSFSLAFSLAANVQPDAPPTDLPVLKDIPDTPIIQTPPPPPPEAIAGPTEYLAEPPIFELPADALARGRPNAGTLLNALQLPVSPDYIIRCPTHAYASASTAAELMQALATFRNRSGYHGEIVVGDLSQDGGGRYGPHKSHQSGRDVDLWLPVLGGFYKRGCVRCGTDLCRPEPNEVDWKITWQLVQALASRGTVQDAFLAWELQPALRDAARQLGAPDAELARQIQHPIRGRAALVKHADGHTHHLHLRFRCPANDPGCITHP